MATTKRKAAPRRKKRKAVTGRKRTRRTKGKRRSKGHIPIALLKKRHAKLGRIINART